MAGRGPHGLATIVHGSANNAFFASQRPSCREIAFGIANDQSIRCHIVSSGAQDARDRVGVVERDKGLTGSTQPGEVLGDVRQGLRVEDRFKGPDRLTGRLETGEEDRPQPGTALEFDGPELHGVRLVVGGHKSRVRWCQSLRPRGHGRSDRLPRQVEHA